MNKQKTMNKSQLWTLIRLQLMNLYGLNVYRNLKDPKEKKKKFWLGVAYVFVILVFTFYVGAMSFGYVFLGLEEILPAYLIMIASVVILLFSIFKTGSVIYQRNAYDILSSLPLKHSHLVLSRFVRLYVENIAITVVVMLPAMVVFGVLVKPDVSFYLIGLIVTMFIPMLPITISVFVGSLITAAASRFKHKNAVSIVLSLALVVVLMLGSVSLGSLENVSIEEIQSMLGMVLDMIEGIYPPAVWLGEAMLTGNYLLCFGCVMAGVVILALIIALVSATYKWVSIGLYTTYAKHEYKMERLQQTSLLKALYIREFKRYFSSGVYVTNTVISPVMGMLVAVAFLVISPEQMAAALVDMNAQTGLVLNLKSVIPFALATTFCMMPITAVSVSMEGKQFWLVKSLPISTKDFLNSKLLMSLSVVVPFYVLAVLLVLIGQRPSVLEAVWIIIVPLVAILFSNVYGQTVNLKLAVFDWENEVTVVKQSASAFVGGVLPVFVLIFATMGMMVVPEQYANPIMLGVCLVLGLVTVILYKKNRKVNLLHL